MGLLGRVSLLVGSPPLFDPVVRGPEGPAGFDGVEDPFGLSLVKWDFKFIKRTLNLSKSTSVVEGGRQFLFKSAHAKNVSIVFTTSRFTATRSSPFS